MHIVVTGGAGFIGKHLLDWLTAQGHTALVLDDFSTGRTVHVPPSVQSKRIDLTTLSSSEFAGIFEDFGADAVVHLAGIHFIPDCMARPERTLAVNTASTHTIVEALLKRPVRRLVIASTLDIYSVEDRVHVESEAPAPANVYGLSKTLGEQVLAYAHRLGACQSAVALRLGNVYGPCETNPHLIPDAINRISEPVGKELVMGYLGSSRDFVFVKDVAEAFGLAVTEAPAGFHCLNIGTGMPVAVREVVATLQRLANDGRPMRENPRVFRDFDRISLTPEVDAAYNLLRWRARWQLEDGLVETLRRSLRERADG
jgi:UDP-glucose 4-epimerase